MARHTFRRRNQFAIDYDETMVESLDIAFDDNRAAMLAAAAIFTAVGVYTTVQMPVDVFPDLTAPTVTILTEGRGMAPEEMETLVTFPIEAALNGASNVRRVRSATAVGIALWHPKALAS